jgi:hypothetical protein
MCTVFSNTLSTSPEYGTKFYIHAEQHENVLLCSHFTLGQRRGLLVCLRTRFYSSPRLKIPALQLLWDYSNLVPTLIVHGPVGIKDGGRQVKKYQQKSHQKSTVTKFWKQNMHINYFRYDVYIHVLEAVSYTTEQYTKRNFEGKFILRQYLSPASCWSVAWFTLRPWNAGNIFLNYSALKYWRPNSWNYINLTHSFRKWVTGLTHRTAECLPPV